MSGPSTKKRYYSARKKRSLDFTYIERLHSKTQKRVDQLFTSRNYDKEQAQKLIVLALTITGPTLMLMSMMESAKGFIAIAGILFVVNSSIGVFNQYRARLQDRLRAQQLLCWLDDEDYDAILATKNDNKAIPIAKTPFWRSVTCRGSIAFTLFAFIFVIAAASQVKIPPLIGGGAPVVTPRVEVVIEPSAVSVEPKKEVAKDKTEGK